MKKIERINFAKEDIDQVASLLWSIGKDYTVWSFVGDMGAGKTTLIAAICHFLQVKENVSSPTYALINEYSFYNNGLVNTIYHADWFRLNNANDAKTAGMEDMLYKPNSYSFIEWASQAIELLTQPYLQIKIDVHDENQRSLIIKLT